MLTALDMLKHADKEVKELSGGISFDNKKTSAVHFRPDDCMTLPRQVRDECKRPQTIIQMFVRKLVAGNKRKLSVGIALLADSRVIFLVSATRSADPSI
eukprot:COSAG06_NODE_8515_length_2143_cov_2.722114_4_plen_99_part_00